MRRAAWRIGRSALVLLAVAAVTYAVFYLGPADPALQMCGRPCNPDDLEAARAFMGFDTPWWQQLGAFLAAIFVGRSYGSGSVTIQCDAPCLGYSFQLHDQVTDLIVQRFPVSASVAIGAVVLWMVGAVVAGLVAARNRDRFADRFITGMSVISASAPAFVVGLLALILFAFTLDLAPSGGYVPLLKDPLGWLRHLILPWLVLAFLSGAVYARLIRAGLIDQFSQDYIRRERGNGLPERIIDRDALRNLAVPLSTLLALDIGGLLAGTVITERVFGLPGLGQLLLEAVMSVDLSVIAGTTLFGAVLVVLANLTADLLMPALDPRLRAPLRAA